MNATVHRYNLPFQALTPHPVVSADIRGRFIRCIACQEEIEISLDGGPRIPFGVGRAIYLPNGEEFTHVDFYLDAGTLQAFTAQFVYGTADYVDVRSALLVGQTIRSTAASQINAFDVTMNGAANAVTLAGPGVTGILSLKKITVRNTHATEQVRISTSATEVVTANYGKILGPGEEEDFEVSATLYGAGAAGVVLNVARYLY